MNLPLRRTLVLHCIKQQVKKECSKILSLLTFYFSPAHKNSGCINALKLDGTVFQLNKAKAPQVCDATGDAIFVKACFIIVFTYYRTTLIFYELAGNIKAAAVNFIKIYS